MRELRVRTNSAGDLNLELGVERVVFPCSGACYRQMFFLSVSGGITTIWSYRFIVVNCACNILRPIRYSLHNPDYDMKNLIIAGVLVLLGACRHNNVVEPPPTTPPSIEWQKSLGGSKTEHGHSIQQTSDGGYIVAGESDSNDGDVTGNHGGFDSWIVKLTSGGTTQWQKSLGGSGKDYAYSIQQTSDGGYIVAGEADSKDGDVTGNHGGRDYWIVKLTSGGAIQWQKCFGGSSDDLASSIQQTSDGGYIVAGKSSSKDGDVTGNHGGEDYWIVKLTSGGAMEWQKCFGGSSDDLAHSIQQTSDGGYIVAGTSYSNDGDVTGSHGDMGDYWIVKLTSGGAIQWQKCFGGSGNEVVTSIHQTSDGGYIVAGTSTSSDGDVTVNHGRGDYWIVKITSGGALEWQKCFGGSESDVAFSIQETSDGGFIVAGTSYSNDGDVTGNHGIHDYWIVKLTSGGAIQWQKSLGGGLWDFAFSIQHTSDGGYIVAGYSQSNDGDVTGNHGSVSTLGFADSWVVKLK